MRRTVLLGPILALGLAACQEATGPAADQNARPGTPALESVAYDLVGTGKVAFQRVGGGGTYSAVYLIDGTARRSQPVLDSVSSIVFGVNISPAGGEVAWLRWNPAPESCYSVYLTDLSGGSPRRLSKFTCNSEEEPSWTPSGSGVIIPVGLPDFDRYGIYLRVLQTDELIRLPNASATEPCIDVGPVSVSVRDGMAYSCHNRIYLADSLTRRVAEVYRTASSDSRTYVPAFSPDGSLLAFLEVLRAAPGGGQVLSTSLRFLNLSTREVRTVVTIPGSGRSEWVATPNLVSLCWLPGEAGLAFTAVSAGNAADAPVRANIHVIRADGTGLARLTTAVDGYDYNVSCTR